MYKITSWGDETRSKYSSGKNHRDAIRNSRLLEPGCDITSDSKIDQEVRRYTVTKGGRLIEKSCYKY